MLKRLLVIISIYSCFMLGLQAQHNTSSPYSRYGYGNILDGGFGQSRAMGGISIGMRPSKHTNPMNPASYTSIDSLCFRMEAGMSFQFSNFADANSSTTEVDGNLEFLAFQFPIKKWVAFSFGLMPYSIVGYNFQIANKQASTITSGYLENVYKYEGKGGITQLYAGLGFSPVKWLSFGGNFLFNFGTIEHSSVVSFPDSTCYATTMNRSLKIKDVNGNFGLQVNVPVKSDNLTVGAVFQMKSQLNADATQTIITTDTTELNFDNNFDTPMYFGLGFVYTSVKNFLVGFDFKREIWSDARFFGEKNFYDRNKFAIGAEWIPDVNGRAYLQRVSYRLGANLSSSYYEVNGDQLKSFSLTTGWGFPIKKGLNPTLINVSFEYGHTGWAKENLLREQYFKFTLNATINEKWFVKRKLN